MRRHKPNGGHAVLRILTLLIVTLCAGVAAAQAQPYPDRPVRVMIGFAAGSGPDIQGRTVSQELGNSLGQQFYVENRLGANGTIAARAVATARPDGYTLLFSSSSIISTPWIYRNLGYDTLTDLRPIATVGELDGIFMLVDAKSPIKTLSEFIALAKNERVLYGSPGVGNGLHLATEIFAKKAGIKLQHVPYKGASEVMTALLGGSVNVMFVTPPSVMGLIKEGRVRPLAFTGSKPFPQTPEVPLMKDMLPGYESQGSWGMFFAPGKTPDAIVSRLNAEIRKALAAPHVAGIMQRDGYVPDNRDAAAAAAFFRKEVAAAEEAVKAAGIEPN
jgi:tripartite-type tricarboxylate transporter receptor subunit TctC